MSPTPVARGVSVSKNGLLNVRWRAVTSPLSFIDSNDICHFDRDSLQETVDVVRDKRENTK
jgi:hypothetical protein